MNPVKGQNKFQDDISVPKNILKKAVAQMIITKLNHSYSLSHFFEPRCCHSANSARPLVHYSMLTPQDVAHQWFEATGHGLEGFILG